MESDPSPEQQQPVKPVLADIHDPYSYDSAISNDPNRGPQYSPSFSLISWMLIILVVFGIAGLVSYAQYFVPRSTESSASELLAPNITAKMFIGFKPARTEALKQIEPFNQGPLEQRFCYVILLHEIVGPEKANEQLRKIDRSVQDEIARRKEQKIAKPFPSESQNEVREILGQLFLQYEKGDFDSSTVDESERKLLTKRLGWIANLALTPRQSPDKQRRREIKAEGTRLFAVVMLAGFTGLIAFLGALAATFALIIMYLSRQIQIKFENSTGHGFVYIETFAIWIILFFGSQIGCDIFANEIGRNDLKLVFSPFAFFGSLIALVWPLIRGVSFSTLCRDIGWEIRNPFVEVFVGGFSYLALILPMIAGVAVSVVIGSGLGLLMRPGEFESAGPVGHPIAEEIASGGPIVWLLVILSACVAAPIVEETMFRGVLYRYLRDVTSKSKARWISIAISSVVGGLIFAMIHPQGIIGIPILTTLAIGFSLVREWRNSLIAPMVMHAINNGIVTCLLFSIMG